MQLDALNSVNCLVVQIWLFQRSAFENKSLICKIQNCNSKIMFINFISAIYCIMILNVILLSAKTWDHLQFFNLSLSGSPRIIGTTGGYRAVLPRCGTTGGISAERSIY